MIVVKVISESELATVIKDWNYTYPEQNPTDFKQLLWDLGINVNKPFEKQEGLIHRNIFNKVVSCTRWVGLEREDEEWIESGYASREARVAASGSKLVADMDRFKYKEF